jgi:hypothetical protein
MDDPAGGLEMADQYETAARIALDRVGAEYALTIPFTFAFYGDLWRANQVSTQAARLTRKLNGFGPFAPLFPLSRTGEFTNEELGVCLALELLANAQIPIRRSGAAYGVTLPLLTGDLRELWRYEPGVVTQGMLWHIATSVATYLTTPALREQLTAQVARQIESGCEEVVLLAHDLGSLICYDLLLRRPELPVRCLVTLGSPLGMEIVRAALTESIDLPISVADSAESALPFPACLPRWINLHNSADSVASSCLLSPLYKSSLPDDSRHVEDIDTGKPRPPSLTNLFAGHHPAIYLSSKVAGIALRSVVER